MTLLLLIFSQHLHQTTSKFWLPHTLTSNKINICEPQIKGNIFWTRQTLSTSTPYMTTRSFTLIIHILSPTCLWSESLPFFPFMMRSKTFFSSASHLHILIDKPFHFIIFITSQSCFRLFLFFESIFLFSICQKFHHTLCHSFDNFGTRSYVPLKMRILLLQPVIPLFTTFLQVYIVCYSDFQVQVFQNANQDLC